MNSQYDMYVDYDILCEIQDKLQKIEHDLYSSAEEMKKTIEISQGHLSGEQFERAKGTTAICIGMTSTTGANIRHSRDYLAKLKTSLEEYGRCAYSGET